MSHSGIRDKLMARRRKGETDEKTKCKYLCRGGGSPEQSQRVVFASQLDENKSQTSARQAKPRFRLQARALAFNAKGGVPAEAAERHPQSDPSGKLTKEVLAPSDWSTKNPYCHPELVSGSAQRYR